MMEAIRKPVFIQRLLTGMAVLVSVYLFWQGAGWGNVFYGCGEGSGCAELIHTSWGYVFGIPVSLFGAFIYGGLFTSYFDNKLNRKSIQLFLLTLAIGSGLWFLYLQIIIVEAFCFYCNTVHFCGLILTILFAIKRPDKTGLMKKGTIYGVAGGLIALITYILIQLYFPSPDTYDQYQTELSLIVQKEPNGAPEQRADNGAKETYVFAGGKVIIENGAYPLLGSADAPIHLAILFDYTCVACRLVHKTLTAFMDKKPGQFSVVLIPVPLSGKCNKHMRETDPVEKEFACLYARLALAVWEVEPSRFAEFETFMLKTKDPPAKSAVLTFTQNLIGRENLAITLADPQVETKLQESIHFLYEPYISKPMLPVLLFSETIQCGLPQTPKQLLIILKRELKL